LESEVRKKERRQIFREMKCTVSGTAVRRQKEKKEVPERREDKKKKSIAGEKLYRMAIPVYADTRLYVA